MSKKMKKYKRIENHLIEAVKEVQILINQKFSEVNEQQNRNLSDHTGLKNGDEIVGDYVNHGEYGIALDHIDYMIETTDLQISEQIREHIIQASSCLKMTQISDKYIKKT